MERDIGGISVLKVSKFWKNFEIEVIYDIKVIGELLSNFIIF